MIFQCLYYFIFNFSHHPNVIDDLPPGGALTLTDV